MPGGRASQPLVRTILPSALQEAPGRRPPDTPDAHAFLSGRRVTCQRARVSPWLLWPLASRSLVAATVSPSCRSGAGIRAADFPVTTRAPLWSPECAGEWLHRDCFVAALLAMTNVCVAMTMCVIASEAKRSLCCRDHRRSLPTSGDHGWAASGPRCLGARRGCTSGTRELLRQRQESER